MATPRWTPELDAILVESIRQGETYARAAERVRRATRGRFNPHPTTCMRRIVVLDEKREASTRVDAKIPPRVRASLATRSSLPPANVYAIPLALVERQSDGGERFTRDLLSSILTGWTFDWADVDETRADAIACSRHHAALRGDRFDVLENEPGRPAIVSIGKPGEVARPFVLVVVRYSFGA